MRLRHSHRVPSVVASILGIGSHWQRGLANTVGAASASVAPHPHSESQLFLLLTVYTLALSWWRKGHRVPSLGNAGTKLHRPLGNAVHLPVHSDCLPVLRYQLKSMPNKDNPLIFWLHLFVKWGKETEGALSYSCVWNYSSLSSSHSLHKHLSFLTQLRGLKSAHWSLAVGASPGGGGWGPVILSLVVPRPVIVVLVGVWWWFKVPHRLLKSMYMASASQVHEYLLSWCLFTKAVIFKTHAGTGVHNLMEQKDNKSYI